MKQKDLRKVSEVVDTLSLNESNPHNRYFFNFVVAQSFYYSSINADGNLGLARNYTHPINSVSDDSTIDRFSFLEMLYNLNIINQNVFYHRYKDDQTGRTDFCGILNERIQHSVVLLRRG